MRSVAITVARSGHELPVYPSYYPHEIEIATVAPDRAGLLRDGKIHAYVGGAPRFAGAVPETISAVESLGSLVTVRVNPVSPHGEGGSIRLCRRARGCARDRGEGRRVILHPYPVTPLHGDYLNHVDLRRGAAASLLGSRARCAGDRRSLKVRATGALAKRLAARRAAAPDVGCRNRGSRRIASLVASAMTAINGWLGRAGLKSGWYQAYLLLGDAIDPEREGARGSRLRRLQSGDLTDAVERINLEREFVARARRRLPQDRHRLHGEARIFQCRVLGRHREHRATTRTRASIRRCSSAP